MDVQQVRSVEELTELVASGAPVKYLFFWGHQPERDGSVGKGCLSQWWPARFSAEGEYFGSAEHYMMWRKATLFGDREHAEAVLRAETPAEAKNLGRQVRGFDDATWAQHRWQIVVDASLAKFGSDPALREYLLRTGQRVLVEASPRDRIWGIGMGAESEYAAMPDRWRGLNLLGFALMEARARLTSAQSGE